MRCKFVFVCNDGTCSKPEPPCRVPVEPHCSEPAPVPVVLVRQPEPPCPTVRHIPNIPADDPCDTSANKYGAFGAAVQVGPVYGH